MGQLLAPALAFGQRFLPKHFSPKTTLLCTFFVVVFFRQSFVFSTNYGNNNKNKSPPPLKKNIPRETNRRSNTFKKILLMPQTQTQTD